MRGELKSTRSPVRVCRLIKAEIPADLKDHHEYIDKLIYSFLYKSPEQIPWCFLKLSEFVNYKLLNDEVPLKTEWKIKVAAILCDKSVNEIKKTELISELKKADYGKLKLKGHDFYLN